MDGSLQADRDAQLVAEAAQAERERREADAQRQQLQAEAGRLRTRLSALQVCQHSRVVRCMIAATLVDVTPCTAIS